MTETAAASTGSQSQTPQASQRIRIYTDPPMPGAPTGVLNALADKVNEFASAYPETFSGAYFASDYSKVYVGVAEPRHAAATAYEELATKMDPGRRRIVTVDVKWSWSELDAVKNVIVQKYLVPAEGGIQSVGLNTSIDSVVVGVLRQPGDVALTDNPTLAEIARRYGDVVVFREESGPITAAAK
ncbi:hypothetical protein [Arthrobacter sp. NPDC056727]|uniref:hypothetical protein n=1 Tax=Arthrobacter sp. NPDC056727 TaxID=3345927 RepID=UPI0036723473